MTTILGEPQAEAQRVIAAAAAQGLTMRLLGGIAVLLQSPSATQRPLTRGYGDLDFAVAGKRTYQVERLMIALGYRPDQAFNLYHGDDRLLFFDDLHARQVDIFLDTFRMCHHIPLKRRMGLEPLTLPLAELLLTKLQIVEMNEKDALDLCALLLDHPFGDSDQGMFNLPRIAKLCANDWGLWKTVNLSAQKVRHFCAASALTPAQKNHIFQQLELLDQALRRTPKTLVWHARNTLGERVRWYELPEEVQRGPALELPVERQKEPRQRRAKRGQREREHDQEKRKPIWVTALRRQPQPKPHGRRRPKE